MNWNEVSQLMDEVMMGYGDPLPIVTVNNREDDVYCRKCGTLMEKVDKPDKPMPAYLRQGDYGYLPLGRAKCPTCDREYPWEIRRAA